MLAVHMSIYIYCRWPTSVIRPKRLPLKSKPFVETRLFHHLITHLHLLIDVLPSWISLRALLCCSSAFVASFYRLLVWLCFFPSLGTLDRRANHIANAILPFLSTLSVSSWLLVWYKILGSFSIGKLHCTSGTVRKSAYFHAGWFSGALRARRVIRVYDGRVSELSSPPLVLCPTVARFPNQ